MDEDTNDAWWHQAQLEEQQRWEHFHKVNNEFRAWARAEGFLPKQLVKTTEEHQ